MELEKEYNYELQYGPLKYAKDGELVEAEWITLNPPTSYNSKECAFLKQAVYRSLPERTPEEVEKAKETLKEQEVEAVITGEEILMLLYKSQHVELANVLVVARDLFSSKGIALVDGEEKVTKKILDEMHPQDFEEMLGEYIARFIMASVFQKKKKH